MNPTVNLTQSFEFGHFGGQIMHTGASKQTVPIKISPKSINVLSPKTEHEKAEGMII